MKLFGRLLVVGVSALAALQLVRPGIPTRSGGTELQAPNNVKRILEKDCYSCHSDQRKLSWFDQIVPSYWLVRHDIITAREHLNFSTLGSQPAAVQNARLYEAVNMVQLGAMPLPQFTQLHPEARVTAQELETLKKYLAPWSRTPQQPAGTPSGAGIPQVSLASVSPEFNGIAFDGDFENWKPISTTDRGDNYSFRFILGNDVAVKAAQAGNISRWPEGTRFAKIAWQQQAGPDGLLHPGKFIQVELMIKDSKQYKRTDGWGWGRWRGLELRPYGNNAGFVNECTGCHLPVRGDDYVYTLPITPARIAGKELTNRNAAALPAGLPYQPLSWGAITMFVDPRTHTTATLYGNSAAMAAVRARGAVSFAYPAGAVLALVTWAQRDDPHWFGARIPDAPRSVEFIQFNDSQEKNVYRRFSGVGLLEDHPPAGVAAQRISFVVGLAPVQLP